MLENRDQLLNNIIYGVAMGYNSCCITYFNLRQVNGDMFKDMSSNIERKLTGTGFMCCPECDAKYTEKELIDQINQKRLIDSSFPNMREPSDILVQEIVNKEKTRELFFSTLKEMSKYVELR